MLFATLCLHLQLLLANADVFHKGLTFSLLVELVLVLALVNLLFQVRPHLQTLLNDLSLVFFFLVHLFLRVAFDDGGPLWLRHTDSFIRCH